MDPGIVWLLSLAVFGFGIGSICRRLDRIIRAVEAQK